MASVTRLASGRYKTWWRDDEGKSRSKTFDRKGDAQRHASKVTVDLAEGTYLDPRSGKITFREWSEQWRSAAPHGPTTGALIERNLRKHAFPAFGDLPLKSILPFHIESWVKKLPLSPSSAKLVLGHVSQVFGAAVRNRLIATNPCRGVTVPRARKGEVWIPERPAAIALIEKLPDGLRGAAELAIGTGMRQGELMGLEVDQIDFLRGRSVEVRQQLLSLSGQKPYLGPTKTESSRRVIPLAA